MANRKDFPGFPGLLVSDPREWDEDHRSAVMQQALGSMRSTAPLISTLSPSNGGLQQFSRPINIYTGQQGPVKLGMDGYKDTLQKELDDNPAAAAWAAFGSQPAEQLNEFARMFGYGDRNFTASNQVIRDNYPEIAKLGDKAEDYVIGRFGKIPRVVLQGILATDNTLNNR